MTYFIMILFYRNVSADDLRSSIEEIIDDFININFTLHPKAISETANKKIRNGNTKEVGSLDVMFDIPR